MKKEWLVPRLEDRKATYGLEGATRSLVVRQASQPWTGGDNLGTLRERCSNATYSKNHLKYIFQRSKQLIQIFKFSLYNNGLVITDLW